MSDYIAWYAVELRSRLAPTMSRAEVEAIVKEARSHLVESAEKLRVDLQISEDAAQLAAIDAFGNPEPVALGHLREKSQSILGLRPIWFVMATGLVAVLCWDYSWLSLEGPFDNHGATWLTLLSGIVGLLALIGFFLSCRAGRQSYGWRVAAAHTGLLAILPFAACTLALTSPNGYGTVLRPQISRVERSIPRSLDRLNQLQTFFEVGGNRFASAKSAADLPLAYRDIMIAEDQFGIERGSSYPAETANWEEQAHAFAAPASSVWATPDGDLLAFQGVTTFAEAKALWPKNMPSTRASIARQRQNLNAVLARIHEAESGRVFFLNPVLMTQVFVWTVLFLPVTILTQWAAFAIIRHRRAWPLASLA